MNKTCKEIPNELIHSGTKISQSDFLKICEKYNLSLIEVDELSKSISDLQLYLNDDTESADEDELIKALKGYNLPYIDNRPKNGVLWVIGGIEIKDIIEQLSETGYVFHFKECGGKATKKRAGWWTK